MKRILLICIVLMALSLQGFAQKGMQGVGLNVAGNVHKGFGLGGSVKYQYNLSDYLRLEPSFSYYSIIAEKDAFEMAGFVNLHLFFSSPNALRPYFLAGAGFVSFKDFHGSSGRDIYSGLGLDTGLGVDFRLTHTISLQAEAGVMYEVGESKIGGKLNIGFCYNF